MEDKKSNFRTAVQKLIGINDSPKKIAFGFGLGLFLGVLPGTGAIAAIVCSLMLRLNKIAALTGALLINTWINVVAFPLALILGSLILKINQETLQRIWNQFRTDFSWSLFLDHEVLRVISSIFFGYLLLGLFLGVLGTILVYYIIVFIKDKNLKQKN